jgi:hypothetical protein
MKTSFARLLTLAILPFLALPACDQQPTHYRQLPAHQPTQTIYVEPVAPPPTTVIIPVPSLKQRPVAYRDYAPQIIKVRPALPAEPTTTTTVIRRETVGAPIPVTSSAAANTRGYATPTPAPAMASPQPSTLGATTGVGALQDRGNRPMNAPIGAPLPCTRALPPAPAPATTPSKPPVAAPSPAVTKK